MWSSEFFSFQIFQQRPSKPTKLAKKITQFTIQFRSKNLTHFTNLNSLGVESNMLPQYSQKPFWLKNFSSKHVSVWCQKNICTAPFLDAQELHSSSSLKANVCIFLYIPVRDILFQRRSKILSSEGSFGVTQNDFLNVARRLGSENVLQFLIFIEIFRNSTVFQHLNTPIYSIKTLKFSRQFGLHG